MKGLFYVILVFVLSPQGNYGCKRFLRDGYETVKEVSTELHVKVKHMYIYFYMCLDCGYD